MTASPTARRRSPGSGRALSDPGGTNIHNIPYATMPTPPRAARTMNATRIFVTSIPR